MATEVSVHGVTKTNKIRHRNSDAPRISKVGLGGPIVLENRASVKKCGFDDFGQLPFG